MKTILLMLFFFTFAFEIKSTEVQEPHTVYLKPGTILTRLSDKQDFKIEKGIFAKVSATNYKKRDQFAVFDENGKALYETSAEHIVEVESDIRILPIHQANVIYPSPSKFKLADKTMQLETSFNIHLDNLLTEEFNAIYSDNLSIVQATRFELRTVYARYDFPIQIGGNINYQSTSWRNDFDQVKLSILSFGPVFQYGLYRDEDLKVSALLGAEFSPVYRTSSGDSLEKYRAMLFDIGIESIWKTQYGDWSLGSHFRKHNISLEKTTRPGVAPITGEMTITSVGIMVGYQHEWDL